jgi:hypothetical protein
LSFTTLIFFDIPKIGKISDLFYQNTGSINDFLHGFLDDRYLLPNITLDDMLAKSSLYPAYGIMMVGNQDEKANCQSL